MYQNIRYTNTVPEVFGKDSLKETTADRSAASICRGGKSGQHRAPRHLTGGVPGQPGAQKVSQKITATALVSG